MGLSRYLPTSKEGRKRSASLALGGPLGKGDEGFRSLTGQREYDRDLGRIDRFAATQPDWAQMREGILRGVEEGKRESQIAGSKFGRQATWDVARRGIFRSGLKNIAMRDVARRRMKGLLREDEKGAAQMGELDLERRGWLQRLDDMRRAAKDKQRNTKSSNIQTGLQIASTAAMLFSDERLKADIETIPGALEKVGKLRGVGFRWKSLERDQSPKIGLIAQEVQPVVPEVVYPFRDREKTLAVDYQSLGGLFVEAIKELKAKVEKQEAEISDLKAAAVQV